jgi:hypothetical protein
MQNFYKLNLHAVTPGATFAGRKLETIIARSGWLVLDFDKLSLLEVTSLLKKLLCDPVLGPSIVLAFISPRGAGLKAWVRIDLQFEHEQCYDAIITHLRREHPEYAAKVDSSGRDITRLCFLCHDPNAYLNPDHAIAPAFPMPTKDWHEIFDDSYNPNAFADTREVDLDNLERWVSVAEQIPDFADDYEVWRNLGFAFASIGERGRSFFHRVSRTSTKYNEKENNKCFSYWLKNHNGGINLGTFFHQCKEAGISLLEIKVEQEVKFESDVLLSAVSDGLIPQDLYARLPQLPRDACAPFEGDEHLQAVMLWSTLGLLGGCVSGVGGYYGGCRYGLNLFVLITAPPGNGKRTMLRAQQLIMGWHKRLQAASKTALDEYEAKVAHHRATNASGALPSIPQQQVGIIPGNITGAAFIDRLYKNGGRGTMIESEVATLIKALGGEHGQFTDNLCAVFQEEPIRVARKGGNEYIEIERPKLTIVATGVPEQIGMLFRSATDGLLSRFVQYSYQRPFGWKSGRPSQSPRLDDYYDQLAERVDQMLAQMPQPTEDGKPTVEITLSEADWDRLDAQGAQMLDEAVAVADGVGASSAFRLGGLITFRIIGILTILRCFDEGRLVTGVIEAQERDVTIALTLSAVSHVHALKVIRDLFKSNVGHTKGSNYNDKAEKRALVRKLRTQPVPMPYREIERLHGIAANTACTWAKEMGLR